MSFRLEGLIQESPLWLEDGNVVLTTSNVVFKVHRGVLERHSEVFRDILSLPQPDTAQEFDGTPMIHMHDEPRDLECFLLALYDGLYAPSSHSRYLFVLTRYKHSYFEQCRAHNFVILCGVLRLSIKYTVEHLRLECLKLLQHDWPTTLTGWDLRERETMNPEGTYEYSAIRAHPIYIINLAHELGADGATLLPAAFYDLSRFNCSHIWTGCTPMTQESEVFATGTLDPYAKLSAADLQAVMLGKEAAQSYIAQFLRQELESREVAVLCENSTYQEGLECRKALEDLSHELYCGVVGVSCGRDSDPLFMLDAAMILQRRAEDGGVGVHPASKACEQCRAEFAEAATAARRYVWDQLPCWFGLEGDSRGVGEW